MKVKHGQLKIFKFKDLIKVCIFFGFILIIQNANGNDLIFDLNKINQEIIVSIADLEFIEDPNNNLTIEYVSDFKNQSLFIKRPDFTKNNFNPKHTYWVKLTFRPTNQTDKNWLLEFYDQSINFIEAFVPNENKEFNHFQMGSSLPFEQRTFVHKNFQLLVPSDLNEESHFYFKINSNQKADIRIALRSYERFVYYALNEYLFYGLFYGMISIIAFYNLIMFLAVRELKYLYYIFYLISVSLFTMSLDGIGYQFLWPNTPEFNNVANGVFSFSLIFWAIIFTIRFLNTKRRARVLHYGLIASLLIKTFYFFSGLFINLKYFEIGYYDVLPFSIIFITSIYVWVKGHKSARLFVIAYGVLFIGALIKFLATLAIIEHNTPVYYSLHFAFLLEMILLSFALGDRIRIMKDIRDRALKRSLNQYKENIELKEKVNKELELKVKERTVELEKKNSLLETFNNQLKEKDQQIKKMNSLLDKDNWKLKSSIRASLRARLTNKSLTYEEFKKIFPEGSACNRFLEELKWGKTFSCRQCSGSKFSNGPKVFTRRCSKCGFIDSVTAGTIFHGIRFPLEKAFYIAYTVISQSEQMTLEQLSDLVDLRKNTIWSFKKKIKENIKEEIAIGDLTFEELILSNKKSSSKTF